MQHACANVERYLPSEVVGQELAVRQLTDAVCHHLAREHPTKPLVISVHGPPGVGKTLTHQLLAWALYNERPRRDLQCPGRHCKGYRVFYGVQGWRASVAWGLGPRMRLGQLPSLPFEHAHGPT